MVLKRPDGAGIPHDGVRDPEYRLDDGERKIWSAALAGAGMAAPILLRPLMMMQPYKSKLVDMSAIDEKWRVALGDKFFEYPQREREAIVTHECLHATCNHFQRAKKAGLTDPDMLNVAEDLEINQMIADLQRVRLPDGALMPKAKGVDSRFGLIDVPASKSMEEYYKLFSSGQAKCPEKKYGRPDSAGDEEQIGPPPASMEKDINDLIAAMTPQQAGNTGSSESDAQDQEQQGNGGQSQGPAERNGSSGSPRASTDHGDGSDREGDDGDRAGDSSGSGSPGSSAGNDHDRFGYDGESGSKSFDSSSDGNGSSTTQDGQSGAGSGSESDDNEGSDVSGVAGTSKMDESDKPKTNAERGRDLCGNSEMDKIRQEADKAGVRGIADDMRAEAMRDMSAEAGKRLQMNGKAGVSTMDREFLVKLDALVAAPAIPWRRLLQTAMSEYVSKMAYAKTEYSFKRVNRRASSYMTDTVFPSMVGYAPIVMMGIDTSGSRVGDGQFELDARNAEAILKATGKLSKNSFSAFSVDTNVKKTHLVSRVEDINFTGGGGTDMSVAFDFVRNLPRRRRPDIFILSTDGGFDWEKCARVWPKNMKVIILLTDHYYVSKVPSWVYSCAKVIEVTPDS